MAPKVVDHENLAMSRLVGAAPQVFRRFIDEHRSDVR
jgi:hypothetical protein